MMFVFRAVKKNVRFNVNGKWTLSHAMVSHSVFDGLREDIYTTMSRGKP